MTDFIHEQPKDPQEQKTPAYVPPKTEAERQKKVYKYVGILFLVAAILIAWSFLMTHRSNQQVLSELKESTSTLQSAFDKNEELSARVEELEAELAKTENRLQGALAANSVYEESSKQSEAVLCAMDYLREIEREYGAKRYNSARTLIEGFEDNDLAQYLPATALHTDPSGNDAVSPAESYQTIVKALFPNGLRE